MCGINFQSMNKYCFLPFRDSERIERHKEERAEKERRDWQEQERLDREERERAQREAVQQHFEESLRLALQKVNSTIKQVIFEILTLKIQKQKKNVQVYGIFFTVYVLDVSSP